MTLIHVVVLLVGLIISFSSTAAPSELPCPKDGWTAACFEQTSTGRRLKAQYLRRVKFQQNGFAVLFVEPRELVGINRNGSVVIPGIISGTTDYRDAEDGIARFSIPAAKSGSRRPSRCGYFRLSDFKVVIPAIYDYCGAFFRGQAYTCTDCQLDCVECHSLEYYGGQAYYVNKRNQILKQEALPTLPRCSTVEQHGGFPRNQPCRPDNQ